MAYVADGKSVTVDVRALEELSEQLVGFEKEVAGAIRYSLARSKQTANASVPREVAKIYALTPENIKTIMKSRYLTVDSKGGQSLNIEISGRMLTYGRFPHAPVMPYIGCRLPVHGTIYNGSPLMKLKKIKGVDGKMKSPFMMKTGAADKNKIQFDVFYRTGEWYTPKSKSSKYGMTYKTRHAKGWQMEVEKVAPVYRIGIPQMILGEKTVEPITKSISATFEKNLYRELKRRIGFVKEAVESI